MTAPDLAGLLAALPVGRTMWIEVRGRSMWPALWPGDRLFVQRAEAAELQPGDVAVMARPDGALVSHLVRSLDPLVTVSFKGRPDEGLTPLGRALRVRRDRREWALRPTVLLAAHRAWSAAARSPLQPIWRWTVRIATSPPTRPLREALFGPVELGPLQPHELHDAALMLSRWESPSPAELEALVDQRLAIAARSRAGAIVGLALADRVYVLERFRGLGLEEQLTRRSRSARQGG